MGVSGRCRTATLGLGRASPTVATPSPGRARRRTRRLAALAAVLVVGLAGASWFDAGFEDHRSRIRAAVEAGKLRPGITREDVHGLLGAPDWSKADHDGWDLGQGLLSIDGVWYVVRYGPDGRVTGFGLVQG